MHLRCFLSADVNSFSVELINLSDGLYICYYKRAYINSNMRYIIFSVLSLLSLISLAQNLDELSDAQWVNDLDELAQTIKTRHARPYHSIGGQYFSDKIDNLSYRIPELSTAEKLVEFIKIASVIGDGHTAMGSIDYFKLYPIVPFWFDNELRALWLPQDLGSMAGWKITAIDGKPINEVKAAVDELSPQGENDHLLIQWSQSWIRNADVLHVLGITESETQATYTLESDDGQKKDLLLNAIAQEDYGQMQWQAAFDPIPNFMTRKAEPIWFEKADDYTLYVSFNHYPDQKVMKDVTNKLLVRLEDHQITHVVIDFRENAGGDFNQGLYLIKKLQKSDFSEHGEVYVITSRKTFSAAMMNAVHFRDEMGAKIVGEAPSQRPNGYSESYTFTLTHSQLKASCATEYYQLTENESNFLPLDMEIKPDFEMRKVGRDEVLEWVMMQH